MTKFTNIICVGLLATAFLTIDATPGIAQSDCNDFDGQTALYTKFTENFQKKTMAELQSALDAAKTFLGKYGFCEGVKEQVEYMKPRVEHLQTQVEKLKKQQEMDPSFTKYDEALAKKLGADDLGMRQYVLVILKTGPKRMPDGKERTEMFAGHFANIKRLAAEGKLALAGPLDGVDGWRGLFVFAVPTIEEAKKLTETDPVIINGEMVAEYHTYYGSAALLLVNELHEKIAKKSF